MKEQVISSLIALSCYALFLYCMYRMYKSFANKVMKVMPQPLAATLGVAAAGAA